MAKKVNLVCEKCNANYTKYESEIKHSISRFCSKKCMDTSRQNGSIQKCEFCNNDFYRRFGEQKKAITQFCSKECYFNNRLLNAKKTTCLKEGSIHKHILVAEKCLNRKLKKGEVVHHIDENKHNNEITNLAILPSQSIHAKVHFGNYDFEKYKLINLINEK